VSPGAPAFGVSADAKPAFGVSPGGASFGVPTGGASFGVPAGGASFGVSPGGASFGVPAGGAAFGVSADAKPSFGVSNATASFGVPAASTTEQRGTKRRAEDDEPAEAQGKRIKRSAGKIPNIDSDNAKEYKWSKTSNAFTFGSNETGQLGFAVTTDDVDGIYEQETPTALDVLADKQVVRVAAGGMHSVVVTVEGDVYTWGCNDDEALGHKGEEWQPGLVEGLEDEQIVLATAGDNHTAVLSAKGEVFTWGTYKDANGYLGFSAGQKKQALPAKVKGLPDKDPVTQVASGDNHTLCVTAGGKVFGWGDGAQSQLGRNVISRHKENGLAPRALAFAVLGRGRQQHIVQVACGSFHSFALSESGVALSWGLGNYGQLGLGDCENRTSPEIIEIISDIRTCQIAAGAHHSVVCTADNKVFTFGRNTYGQLGHGDNTEKYTPTEVTTLNGATVTGVGAGANSSFAVAADGSLYAWGYGDGYVLGTGKEEDSIVPAKCDTDNLKGYHVLQVSSGGMHSILLATKASGDEAVVFR